MKTHIFSILCDNVPGVMMRVSRCFTRRQINIDSITVGIEPSGLARIILSFQAEDQTAEHMRKVLERLIPIIQVEIIDPSRAVVREVALLKTRRMEERELMEFVEKLERTGGKMIEIKDGVATAELSGEHFKVEEAVRELS
ncbi:MAG: acetolactate synthase small subunit, partial [Candidatus Hadarchaeales archaeon]